MAQTAIPRPEYPRPQMVRERWLNLNGSWQFDFDFGRSGRARGLAKAVSLPETITVPFCPESKLSGIGYTDFIPAAWYRRTFTLPAGWQGDRVFLHFGAVDYEAQVWVNGQSVGAHRGGYSAFCFDITAALVPGGNAIVVCAEDDTRSGSQPSGKQSPEYASFGCLYTRTTGIWQTVWLEAVPQAHVKSLRLTPDGVSGKLHVEAVLSGHVCGKLTAAASFAGKPVGQGEAAVCGRAAHLTLDLAEKHLWGPGEPNLYDLTLTLTAGGREDRVQSYFGLRDVSWNDRAMLLNGKPVFQRLILDQGFYPDGIYTAPTDEDLKRDVELSMSMGFNGARLHQKIFEPRLLYWADKLGYLVWGEHASWGLEIDTAAGIENFLPEWLEAVERDYSHPSIVGWCPFNETHLQQDDKVLETVYRATKAVDATRPVIDTSGYVHVVTDIYDVHDYDQNPATFRARYEPLAQGGEAYVNNPGHPGRDEYRGQPYFVSEYGGIWWNPGQKDSKAWGYGTNPTSEAEFLARYEGLTTALLNNPRVCAFCYTQLTDVEQEVNGLHTYDRKPKFDPALIRRINAQKAAIEK